MHQRFAELSGSVAVKEEIIPSLKFEGTTHGRGSYYDRKTGSFEPKK
jgi:hypothetical protein